MLITLATTNPHKLDELNACAADAGSSLRFVLPSHMPEVEETGGTFEENALIKAQSVEAAPGSGFVLGEDSGLVVETLNGTYGISPFPGLQSNRWLTVDRYCELTGKPAPAELGYPHKNDALLALMQGKPNRNAYYICAMALRDTSQNKITHVCGKTPLQIVEEIPRGHNGFGYDPVTIALELDGKRTTAQLSAAEKNQISHRGKAFRQLLATL